MDNYCHSLALPYFFGYKRRANNRRTSLDGVRSLALVIWRRTLAHWDNSVSLSDRTLF